jgi:hypothetical protein
VGEICVVVNIIWKEDNVKLKDTRLLFGLSDRLW